MQFPDALALVDTALPTPLSPAIALAWITVGGKGGKGKSFAPIPSDFNMFNRASAVHARNKRERVAVCSSRVRARGFRLLRRNFGEPNSRCYKCPPPPLLSPPGETLIFLLFPLVREGRSFSRERLPQRRNSDSPKLRRSRENIEIRGMKKNEICVNYLWRFYSGGR